MSTVVPIDDYSPIYVGDTGKPLSIYVAHKNGFEHILGSAISMKLKNVDTGVVKTCTGSWTIDSNDNGKASYQYQASDVDTAGSWQIWITITINGNPIHVDDGTGNPKILVIFPLPSGV
jgi:hypothetical protein